MFNLYIVFKLGGVQIARGSTYLNQIFKNSRCCYFKYFILSIFQSCLHNITKINILIDVGTYFVVVAAVGSIVAVVVIAVVVFEVERLVVSKILIELVELTKVNCNWVKLAEFSIVELSPNS